MNTQQIAGLIAGFRRSSSDQAESPEKIEILKQLEDSADGEVTKFLAEVAGNTREYDLARIEALKIRECRSIPSEVDRTEAKRTLQRILSDDEDDEIRSYTARTMANFVDLSGVRRLLGQYVLDKDEDEDVRHNAFFALERGGPNPDTRAILERCLSDPEFQPGAERVLRQWGAL